MFKRYSRVDPRDGQEVLRKIDANLAGTKKEEIEDYFTELGSKSMHRHQFLPSSDHLYHLRFLGNREFYSIGHTCHYFLSQFQNIICCFQFKEMMLTLT